MNGISGGPSLADPGPGYVISLAIACAGLPFMSIALGSALRAQAGGDPMRALQVEGLVIFVLAFGVGFAIRLVFWPSAPPGLRRLVRLLVSAIFALGVVLTSISLLLAWRLPETTKNIFLPHTFSVSALLCQSAAVLWLVRYRNNTL